MWSCARPRAALTTRPAARQCGRDGFPKAACFSARPDHRRNTIPHKPAPRVVSREATSCGRCGRVPHDRIPCRARATPLAPWPIREWIPPCRCHHRCGLQTVQGRILLVSRLLLLSLQDRSTVRYLAGQHHYPPRFSCGLAGTSKLTFHSIPSTDAVPCCHGNCRKRRAALQLWRHP